MAKFAIVIACESDRDDAQEFIESIRKVGVIEMLSTVEVNAPGDLSVWAVSELIPVSDKIPVSEVVKWLS